LKRYTKLGLAWLLAAIALLFASCGGAGSMGNMDEGQTEKQTGQPKRA
jgi:Flp pilus assembly protein TadD